MFRHTFHGRVKRSPVELLIRWQGCENEILVSPTSLPFVTHKSQPQRPVSEIVSGSVRAFDGHFIMVGFGKVGSRGLQFRTVLAQSFRGALAQIYRMIVDWRILFHVILAECALNFCLPDEPALVFR